MVFLLKIIKRSQSFGPKQSLFTTCTGNIYSVVTKIYVAFIPELYPGIGSFKYYTSAMEALGTCNGYVLNVRILQVKIRVMVGVKFWVRAVVRVEVMVS